MILFIKRKKNSISIRRFTIIEMLVVMSIMATLMLIASSGVFSAKKALVGKYSKITSMTADALAEIKKGDTNTGGKEELVIGAAPGTLKDLKPAGKKKTVRTSFGATGDVASNEPVADNRPVSPVTKKLFPKGESSAKQKSSPVQTPEEEPLPEGITPGAARVTVVDSRDMETEPFAEFLFKEGSSASMAEYQKRWSKNLENLEFDYEVKKEHNPDITLLKHYFLRETVYRSSPYRTYALRKRLLHASRTAYNEKAAVRKYEEIAEKKFTLVRRGERIDYIPDDGERTAGTYNGITMRRGVKAFKIDRAFVPLSRIPEDVRWRLDETLLRKKRSDYVKTQVRQEKEALEKNELDYIEKTLQAEFPMLQNDKNMVNIR